MNEKDKYTYTLVANGDYLKAGERVALKGKKTKDGSRRRIFLVEKLTNDYGPCRQ